MTPESNETPNIKRDIGDLLKRYCAFGLTPIFLFGMNIGFIGAASKRGHIPWLIIFPIAFNAFLLFGYLFLLYRMFPRYGFPPLRRIQVISWIQGWLTVYVLELVVLGVRFQLIHRFGLDFLGFNVFLFFSTLPLAAWFPKRYREARTSR